MTGKINEILTNLLTTLLGVLGCNEEDKEHEEDEEHVNYLGPSDIKVGLCFNSLSEALAAIEQWCKTNYVPLIIRSSSQGTISTGGNKPGRVQLLCTHGYMRKSTATSARPFQRVNYTACPCRVYLNQQKGGLWKVTTGNFS